MLSYVRNNKKSVIGVILCGIIAFMMVGFGINAKSKLQQSHEEIVIRVNDHEVSNIQYQRHLEDLTAQMRDRLKENFAMLRSMINLEQRAVDSVIEQKLFEDLIGNIGFTPSTAQVELHIASLPFFQKFGLTQENFRAFLQSQGMTGEMLERKMKEELAAQQLQRVLNDLNVPTTEELKAVFVEEGTKSEFEYLELKSDAFTDKVDASDEGKLKSYLEANADTYRKPRTVQYRFVKFDPAEFAGRVEVSPEDIEERYLQKQSLFYEPKQYKLRQIVLKKGVEKKSAVEEMVSGSGSAPAKENEAKKNLAKSIVEQLKGGADFAELAKKHSEDQASAKNGGDRGWVLSSALDKTLREIVDRMEPGHYSDVIDIEGEYDVVFLDEVKDRELKPLEQVKAQLETELRAEDAPEYARVEAENFLSSWQEGANTNLSLAEFAKKQNREAQDTGKLMNAQENHALAPSLTEKILTFSKGDRQTVRVGNNQYVVEITDTKDEYVPELAEVRDDVKKGFALDESRRLAREAGEKAAAELASGKPLAEVAKALGVEVKTTGPITKAEAGNVAFFTDPDSRRKAFALTMESPVLAKPLRGAMDESVVIRLKSKTPPDEKDFAAKLPELRKQEQTAQGARLGAFVTESLKSAADIWVSPTLLDKQKTTAEYPMDLPVDL